MVMNGFAQTERGEPMTDLIDREQALNDYQDICNGVSCMDCPFCINRLYGGCKVENYLKSLPSAEKTGKWIEQDDEWGGVYYECSVCKEAFTLIDGTPTDNLYNYCPNCGSYNREVE